MQALRIVMIAPFGIRPKGTLSARMLPLAQALVRQGHSVQIVAPPVQNPEDAGTTIVYDGVPVQHITLPRFPGPFGIVEQSNALLQAARREQPDLLHLFKPKGFGGLAALAAGNLPMVVDTDDWEGWGGWNDLLPYPTPAKHLFAWQEHDLPRRAAAVTVASRTLQSLVWAMGVPPGKVFYLPNGIGVDKGQTTNNEGELSTARRLLLYTRFWEFDLHELVATLAAIVSQEPTAQLMVIGKGERGEEQQLIHLAARAGLSSNLDYRGWAVPHEIPALLAQARIGLVPLSDTLINRTRCSAKMLELMGAGLALVVADVGQSREYIHHEINGLLVPPHNPGALAAAALRLLRDEPLRQRLSQAARRISEHYSWDVLAPTLEAAYRHGLGIKD
jgi:glycosyltransferase involved in cell wall biosynthesis